MQRQNPVQKIKIYYFLGNEPRGNRRVSKHMEGKQIRVRVVDKHIAGKHIIEGKHMVGKHSTK